MKSKTQNGSVALVIIAVVALVILASAALFAVQKEQGRLTSVAQCQINPQSPNCPSPAPTAKPTSYPELPPPPDQN